MHVTETHGIYSNRTKVILCDLSSGLIIECRHCVPNNHVDARQQTTHHDTCRYSAPSSSIQLQSLSRFICVVIIIIDAVLVYILLSYYFIVNVLVSSTVATADM